MALLLSVVLFCGFRLSYLLGAQSLEVEKLSGASTGQPIKPGKITLPEYNKWSITVNDHGTYKVLGPFPSEATCKAVGRDIDPANPEFAATPELKKALADAQKQYWDKKEAERRPHIQKAQKENKLTSDGFLIVVVPYPNDNSNCYKERLVVEPSTGQVIGHYQGLGFSCLNMREDHSSLYPSMRIVRTCEPSR